MNQMGGIRPGIILLREGTDTSQGKPQLISNINACEAVADSIRSTLGPAGRDKMIESSTDGSVTISNDGATIVKLLEIEHPAAKTLVDISTSQDMSVGDGTTSVVLLAAQILKQLKPLVEENVPIQVLIRHLRLAGQLATQRLRELAIPFQQQQQNTEMLLKVASTALNSKLIANHQDLFAPMVVQAVQSIYNHSIVSESKSTTQQDKINENKDIQSSNTSLDNIRQSVSVQKIPGGDVRQSFLVEGVAFAKTFSYAGFEQMTKKYLNPSILLLNVELELKAEKENAEVRISNVEDYQTIVNAEWEVIYEKLDNCVQTGANIVLSQLPIGDLATQYFADRGLFCAGRVSAKDMKRVAVATGASIQTSTNDLPKKQQQDQQDRAVLGTCGVFEERQVGDVRFNVFADCPNKLVSTIVLRGGTEQFIAESERSIHDAIMVVKRTLLSTAGIVAGGGAAEMHLSRYLHQHALLNVSGKGQLIVTAYAKALEVIPRQLCENAGFDPTDILAALRQQHSKALKNSLGGTTDSNKNSHTGEDSVWYGVDLINGSICNTYEAGVWEPTDNKIHALQAATEAACVILSIDETVKAAPSQDPGAAATGMMDGNNKPMSSMMSNAMQQSREGGGGARAGQLAPGVSYMKGRGG